MKVLKHTAKTVNYMLHPTKLNVWEMSDGSTVMDAGDGHMIVTTSIAGKGKTSLLEEVTEGSKLGVAIEYFMWKTYKMYWEWE